MATEQDPVGQQDVQAELQQVVDAVARAHGGDAVHVVRTALHEAIRAAGVPEQPVKWTDDAAGEIAGGRLLIVDRRITDPDAHRP